MAPRSLGRAPLAACLCLAGLGHAARVSQLSSSEDTAAAAAHTAVAQWSGSTDAAAAAAHGPADARGRCCCKALGNCKLLPPAELSNNWLWGGRCPSRDGYKYYDSFYPAGVVPRSCQTHASYSDLGAPPRFEPAVGGPGFAVGSSLDWEEVLLKLLGESAMGDRHLVVTDARGDRMEVPVISGTPREVGRPRIGSLDSFPWLMTYTSEIGLSMGQRVNVLVGLLDAAYNQDPLAFLRPEQGTITHRNLNGTYRVLMSGDKVRDGVSIDELELMGGTMPEEVKVHLEQLALVVEKDKTNGYAYIGCKAGEGDKQKMSYMSDKCEGAAWCFVPNHCGGIRNGPCKKIEQPFRCQGNADMWRSKMMEGLVQCKMPSPFNTSAYKDPWLQAEVFRELYDSVDSLLSGYPEGQALPLHPEGTEAEIGFMGGIFEGDGVFADQHWTPKHQTAGIINDASGDTSRCFEFDYSAGPEVPDPAGCRFFKETFSPLKGLTKCIQEKVKTDPYRILWEKFAYWNEKHEDVADVARRILKDATKLFGEGLPETGINMTSLEHEVANWRKCDFKCKYMDPFARTHEMIKRVAFKNWASLSIDKVKDVLRRKVVETRSAPFEAALPTLTDGTVDALIGECFKVPLNAGPDVVPREAMMLKEAMPCVPLMWDRVEVPGPPFLPLWYSGGRPDVHISFPKVHPICGRIALTGLLHFNKVAYPINLVRQAFFTFQKEIDDSYCLNPDYSTCQNFAACWERVMELYMGVVHPRCAGR